MTDLRGYVTAKDMGSSSIVRVVSILGFALALVSVQDSAQAADGVKCVAPLRADPAHLRDKYRKIHEKYQAFHKGIDTEVFEIRDPKGRPAKQVVMHVPKQEGSLEAIPVASLSCMVGPVNEMMILEWKLINNKHPAAAHSAQLLLSKALQEYPGIEMIPVYLDNRLFTEALDLMNQVSPQLSDLEAAERFSRLPLNMQVTFTQNSELLGLYRELGFPFINSFNVDVKKKTVMLLMSRKPVLPTDLKQNQN